MTEEELREKAERYAAAKGLDISECLGWGLHGSVWKLTRKGESFTGVLKLHRYAASWRRERDCYLRLREMQVASVEGLEIPMLIGADEDWLAIEMTLVGRPHLLDFGTAWLDERPEFPPEVWEQAEEDAAEKFGNDWPEAQRIIRSLEAATGIIMGDVHPGNLALR